MPFCINCSKGQTKLNEGGYCKICFAEHNINFNSQLCNLTQITEDAIPKDAEVFCENTVTLKETTATFTNDPDQSFWLKMDNLLETRLAAQEKKIKDAVLSEVTKKLIDIGERQKKLEVENKTLQEKVTALETQQKNNKQQNQDNKTLGQKLVINETRSKLLESNQDAIKKVIEKQQTHLVKQDKLRRSKNVVIAGLTETNQLSYGEVNAITDKQKVEVILESINMGHIKHVHCYRTGSRDQGPESRPRFLVVEFKCQSERIVN